MLVTENVLAKAQIFAVHYSKNIPLTDGSIPYQYIKKDKRGQRQIVFGCK